MRIEYCNNAYATLVAGIRLFPDAFSVSTNLYKPKENMKNVVNVKYGIVGVWGLIVVGLMATMCPHLVIAAGPAAVNLGTAGNFVILSKTGISTTGSTKIVGDIGVSPIAASAITGFALTLPADSPFSTSSLVSGKVYAPGYADPTSANLTTAVGDMQTAYTDAAGRAASVTELGAGNIGGLTLAPSVYKWGTGVVIPTDVTLSGGANDVWLFQIAQTLTVSSGVKVILSGGAQASNIFWQVAGQTTLGSYSVFNGSVLDQTAVVLNTGATLNGRALAQTAVTLDANTVVSPLTPGLGFISVTNTEGPVILYVTAYQQWDRTSPNYAANAAQVVEGLYQSNTIAGSIGPTNRTLLVPYIAELDGNITSQWLWASVHVVAKDQGYKFLPGYLTFESWSTDGLLNKTNSFNNPTYYYDPASRGFGWTSSDHRVSNDYATGYWKDTPVSEFIFDGAAGKYFKYNPDGYTYDQLQAYILGYPSDYAVTLRWIFNDGTNNPVSASITLHTKQSTPVGTMGVRQFNASQVVLGLTGSDADSWILQSAPIVKGSSTSDMSWSDEASMNAGNTYLRSTSPGQYYYRVRKQ